MNNLISCAVDEEVEEKPWKGLIPLDIVSNGVVAGLNSEECKTQAVRESSTLQALYFKGQV